MNYAVYKYEINTGDNIVVEIPKDSTVLTVQMQGDQPCIWVIADTRAPLEKRRFRLAGTGHPISDPDELAYIGTYQMMAGSLVFHLFEYTRSNAE